MSLLSVLLNVIILSLLIPSLRSDVSYMQGAVNNMQTQMSSYTGLLLQLQAEMASADSAVTAFTSQLGAIQSLFNATEASIDRFADMATGLNYTCTTGVAVATAQLAQVEQAGQAALQSFAAANASFFADVASLAARFDVNVTAILAGFTAPSLFVPVLSGFSSDGNISYNQAGDGKYVIAGKVLIYNFGMNGGVTGTPSGYLQISTPPPAATLRIDNCEGFGYIYVGGQRVHSEWQWIATAISNEEAPMLWVPDTTQMGSYVNLVTGTFNLQGMILCVGR